MEPNANLSIVRGPSVWSRAEFSGRSAHTTPRMIMAGAGLGLLLAAASRRRGRAMLAAGGASLVGLAVSGRGYTELRGWIRHQLDAWRAADQVDEGSELSFPASDSPSWMGSGTPEAQEPRC
jgi:hypothetical protein